MMLRNLFPAGVLATSMIYSSGVAAQSQFSSVLQNPVGICNGSLPSYEGALRKRPTAIANEGTSVAFISCSMPLLFSNEISHVGVFIRNPSRLPGTVACTLVDGTVGAEAPTPTYYPLSYTFTSGGRTWAAFYWDPAAYALGFFGGPANLSCMLPAGMELNNVSVSFSPTT